MTSPAPRRGEAATGLRERVARAIWGGEKAMCDPDQAAIGYAATFEDEQAWDQDSYRQIADAVLALPEMAELQRRVVLPETAIKSVRSRIAPWQFTPFHQAHDAVQEALASSSATEPAL